MLKVIAAIALLATSQSASAQYVSGYGRLSGTGSNPYSHSVQPRVTSQGTYVPHHYRTNPNSTQTDNFSTSGNYNRTAGHGGTGLPPGEPAPQH